MKRFKRVLKPKTRTSAKQESFGVLDIESRNWIKYEMSGFYDGKDYAFFTSMNEMMEYVFKESAVKTIYMHFGGKFDMNFVLDELVKMEGVEFGEIIPKATGIMTFRATYGGRTVTFADSSSFLPFALKDLSEKFDVQFKKLDHDFTHEEMDKNNSKHRLYLEHDCRALYEIIEKYREFSIVKRAGHKKTTAAQAIEVLRLYLFNEIPAISSRKVDEFVRSSYVGGRTEVFKLTYKDPKGKENMRSYDVNSLYPTVMRDNEFPTKFKHFTSTYDGNAMGFYEATVHVPITMKIPPLPYTGPDKKRSKLLFPVGTFSGIWSTIELEYAKSVGVKILKTGRGAIFENGGHIFRGFINDVYSQRVKAKEIEDFIAEIIFKLVMNACYGRFGLNHEKEVFVIDDGSPGLIPYREIKTPKGTMLLSKKKVYLEKSYSNVAIAAWVTSHARIYMHKLYMKCGDQLYYTDTDSLFTTKRLKVGKDLGALKEETKSSEAVFMGPKSYVLKSNEDRYVAFKEDGNKTISNHKVVIKGMDRKKISRFTVEDAYAFLEGSRSIKVKQEAKIASFKTATRSGGFLALSPSSSRELKSKYNKRLVKKTKDGHYVTEPLVIEEAMENK